MSAKFLLSLLALLVWLSPAAAPLASAAQPPADTACVVLVLDESSSMGQNDPTFLRNTGAKLLVALLDDGDRVGVVRFATRATRLTPELVTLHTPADKTALLDRLRDAPPDGYTDLKAALEQAAGLLQNADCPVRHIVLLSDGHPVLPDGLPAGYVEATLTLARDLNAPIFAIALTTEGESGLMYQLAAATNPAGVVIPARAANDLLDAFLDALARLKDRTVLGSGYSPSPGPAALPLEPGLAQYVSRMTIIAGKPETVSVALVGPGQQPFSPDDPRLVFAYTADPRFAVYTLDNPAPGEWRFDLSGAGQAQARAILRSRLRVAVLEPAVYHPLGAPMPLAASLVEEGADGTLTTLIGQATFSAFIIRPDGSQDAIDQLYDDGRAGDSRAGDGLFGHTYVKSDLPGEYHITFTGYKGVIPAARAVRVLVVPFPQPVILAPSEPTFDFRGQPLPLALRLEGGEPPTLDTGAFAAQVRDPAGETTTVPLTFDGTGWTGEWTPAREGQHAITFTPVDAAYKGVPYTLAAEHTVAIRFIPAITLQDARLDLGLVEVGEVARGRPLPLAVVSSSPQAEALRFDLAGAPGLAITSVSPDAVPAGASTLYLTLAGVIEPGDYTATLLVSARDGLDLPQRELPVTLTVFQPTLTVAPATVDLGEMRADRVEEGAAFALTLASTSRQEETVRLAWRGPEGWALAPASAIIPAETTTTIRIVMSSDNDSLPAGAYQGQVSLAGREGVLVAPAVATVTFTIVPVPWCARWCLPLGGAVLAAVLGGSVLAGYLAGRRRPWGSLKPLKGPAGHPLPGLMPIKSGFWRPGRAIIGSSRRADVALDGGQVRPMHAAIKATRQTVTERAGRPPKLIQVERQVNVVENLGDGLVRVNNAAVGKGQRSAPLQSGAAVTIGEYDFVYRG